MFEPVLGVQGSLRRRKKKYQPLSDIAGLHGIHALGRLAGTRAAAFGLWLNSGRAVARATWIAGGGDIRLMSEGVMVALAETMDRGRMDWWRLRGELKRGN